MWLRLKDQHTSFAANTAIMVIAIEFMQQIIDFTDRLGKSLMLANRINDISIANINLVLQIGMTEHHHEAMLGFREFNGLQLISIQQHIHFTKGSDFLHQSFERSKFPLVL